MKNNLFVIGSSLIFWGFLVVLNFFKLANLDSIKVFSFVLIFYGLITIISSFKVIHRSQLLLTSIFLNTGILLYIISHYEILNWYNLALPSILYVISGGFVILYLENSVAKSFLAASIFFFALSLISIIYFNDSWIVQFAHKTTLTLLYFWPMFLILFGILLIIGKSKRLSSPGRSSGRNLV